METNASDDRCENINWAILLWLPPSPSDTNNQQIHFNLVYIAYCFLLLLLLLQFSVSFFFGLQMSDMVWIDQLSVTCIYFLYWLIFVSCIAVHSGIDVVRNNIKMFSRKKVTLPPGRHKIVILDEVDSMTPAAQQALRRTMEMYANTTRFALACNTSGMYFHWNTHCDVFSLCTFLITKWKLLLWKVNDSPHTSHKIIIIIFCIDFTESITARYQYCWSLVTLNALSWRHVYIKSNY